MTTSAFALCASGLVKLTPGGIATRNLASRLLNDFAFLKKLHHPKSSVMHMALLSNTYCANNKTCYLT